MNITENDSTTDPYTLLGDHSDLTAKVTSTGIELLDAAGENLARLTAAEAIALADVVLNNRDNLREIAARDARRWLWQRGNQTAFALMRDGHDVTQVEVGYSSLADVGFVATITTTPDGVTAWADINSDTPTVNDRVVGRTRMVTTWAHDDDVVVTATTYTEVPEAVNR